MSGPHADERPLRPDELWHRADDEHPGDPDGRRVRYIELMKEAGYIIAAPANLDLTHIPTDMEELLTPGQRAELQRELAKLAAIRRPCWRES